MSTYNSLRILHSVQSTFLHKEIYIHTPVEVFNRKSLDMEFGINIRDLHGDCELFTSLKDFLNCSNT
jgi:hypothetical protein